MSKIPAFSTAIYSGRLQIGYLNHHTKRIHLFHSPYSYYVHSTRPGAFVFDHLGRRVGQLGFNGQMHRD
ncbi:MAG: hypothetical protein AAF846_17045 [Chloroflexota bacterium]